jgi:RND family efflux transporter MFP subunit
VVAPEPARVASVFKSEGDAVSQGEELVRFEFPTTEAETQRQQVAIDRADAAVETARAAEERIRGLSERGMVPRRQLEEASKALSDAEATAAEARAVSAVALSNTEREVVKATVSGIVTKRFHDPGDSVEPTPQDPVIRVIDPNQLEVAVTLSPGDAGRVTPQNTARLTGLPLSPTEAALHVIETRSLEGPTGPVPQVRLAFATPIDLTPGTPVHVQIDVEHHLGVVVVPTSSVLRDGQGAAIFVADGGVAHRRTVHPGLVDGVQTEIVEGIAAGELVIVDGFSELHDGIPVTITGGTASAP